MLKVKEKSFASTATSSPGFRQGNGYQTRAKALLRDAMLSDLRRKPS